MKQIKIVMATAIALPVAANAQTSSVDTIVQDQASFELLRQMTYAIDPAVIRYAVQSRIDDARIDYLFEIGDRDVLFVQFNLGTRRSNEFAQDLLSEVSAGVVSNELIQRAIRETWDIISTSESCVTTISCQADVRVNSRIDQKIQELFPELVEPDAGESDIDQDGSCVATEAELFDAFVEAYQGYSVANKQVIAVSEAPTTQVINRNPYVYRINDPFICELLPGD